MARKRMTNTNFKQVNENLKKQREEEEMQRQIEAEYQKELASQNTRSGLDRVFDVLNVGGYAVNGLVQDGLKGAWEGTKAGLDGFALGNKEYGKEYNFRGTLNKLSDGKWDDWNSEVDTAGKAIDAFKQGEFGKFGVAFLKGATEFAGEVLTDPTTYLGGAGVVTSLTKGTGKRLGGEAVEKVTVEAIKQAGKEKGIELTTKQALKQANKANKLIGATSTVGDVTFAGKTLKGSGDTLRTLGDKTIAPILNSTGDAIRKSGILTPFDSTRSLKKALDSGKLDEFVATLHTKSEMATNKIFRTRYTGEKLDEAYSFKRGKAGTKEGQRQIMDILENPDMYAVQENLEKIENGKAILEDYIQTTTGKAVHEMEDTTAKKVWDNVLNSDKPFEAMQTNNKFEQYVIKQMIDPDNQYKTYQEAYNNFLLNQQVMIKQIPVIQTPIAKMEDVAVRQTRVLSDMDLQTGAFINTSNVEQYQKLLSNNASLAKIVSMNPKRKAEWLNAVLFDGKPFIQVEGINKIDGKLNGLLEAIKRGADEDEIMSKLEGMMRFPEVDANTTVLVDKAINEMFPELATADAHDKAQIMEYIQKELGNFFDKPYVDIALDAEQLRVFNETGKLPNLTQTQKEFLVKSGKQVRIYDKETRQLIFDNLEGTFKKRTSPHAEQLRVAKQAKLEHLKDIQVGKKNSSVDIIETINTEKQALLDNHANTIYEMLDDDLKEIVSNDTIRENFLKNYIDESGNIKVEELKKMFTNDNPSKVLGSRIDFGNGFTRSIEKSFNMIIDMDDIEEVATKLLKELEEELQNGGEQFITDEGLSLLRAIAERDKLATTDVLKRIVATEQQGIQTHAQDILRRLGDMMPKGEGKNFYRQQNIHTIADGLEKHFKLAEVDEQGLKAFMDNIEQVKNFDNLKKGIVDDVALYNEIVKLDAQLPPAYQVKDIYHRSQITPTGEVIEVTFNPYTRESVETVVERSVLETLGEVPEAQLSELDHYLQIQHTDKSITQSIKNFLENTGQEASQDLVLKEGELYARKLDYRLKLDDVSLSSDIKQACEFMFNEFKRMGMKERQIDSLRTMLNNYVPHVLNPEILKNTEMLEKLKKQDPELYRTIFASSGDKFNRFGTQRSQILEEKVKAILGEKYGDATKFTGKTVAEVNEALKPLLKEYGFDGDFFIHEIFDAYSQRLMTHGELIYADKTIDNVLQAFGVPVNIKNYSNNKTYYLNQRNMKAIFDGLDETKQFMLLQEMGVDFDRVLNKMMIEVPGQRAEQLFKAVEKYGNAKLELFELPQSLAELIQKKGYVQQIDDTNAFLKVYDKFTNIWKQNATVINPGFHMRNAFSNNFQNFLAVGTEIFNPVTRNTTKRVLNGEQGSLVLKNGQEITFKQIREYIVGYDITSMQNFDMANLAVKEKTLFGEELKGGGGLLEAIGKRVGLDNPKVFNKLDPTDTANFLPYVAGRKFGGGIEDFDRALNFIANLKNGLDAEDAAEMVEKFLFDYSDLTTFETNVMKRIIPFYTWLRKNAPLQMEMLLEKPWLYAGIGDVHRLANEGADQEHLPNYMQDWIKIPFKIHDKDMYVNPNLPYQNLSDLFITPSSVAGMINPLPKTILEVGTNHNSFFDSPIYNEDDTMDEALGKIGRYTQNTMLGAWPTLFKGVSAVGSGDIEKIISSTGSLATGVKVGIHDTQKAKEDAIYRAIRAIEEEYEKNQLNKRFNDSFETYKNTKLEKYGYK